MRYSFYQKRKNKFVILFGMRNVTIDMCKFFNGIVATNFVTMATKDLRNYSNFFHPCPFSVNSLFYWRLFTVIVQCILNCRDIATYEISHLMLAIYRRYCQMLNIWYSLFLWAKLEEKTCTYFHLSLMDIWNVQLGLTRFN